MLRNSFFGLLGLLAVAVSAQAHDYQLNTLHIAHPWSRALPPVAAAGAAYLDIENRGDVADALVAARSPMAAKIEIHQHLHVDGLMKMQQVERVSISPGDQVSLAPGGYHLMLFGLKQPLRAGERYPLTLVFEHGGEIEVEVTIEEQAPSSTSQEPEPAQHQHH